MFFYSKKSPLIFFLSLLFFSFSYADEILDETVTLNEDFTLNENIILNENINLNSIQEPSQESAQEPEEYEIPESNRVIPEPQQKKLETSGVNHPITEKFRKKFLTASGQKLLASILEASTPYRPYVKEKLIERNMPLFLQYLPVIESNYKLTAVSRTGATGMWQFMENSMVPFLKKNSWYDERLDPWKSTDAALSKLQDNYKMFGDWLIAIAAYNCGAGAMRRVLKQNPGKDFWYLAEHGKLRSQTTDYVPKLIAVYDVVENAEHYGALEVGLAASLIDGLAPEKFEYAKVKGMYSLNQISECTGIPRSTLDFLNPSLTRHCTPAGETYALRVPHGMASVAEEKISKAGKPSDAIVHKVVKGDSLWAISRKYGVTVKELCAINNIKENGILSIGQVLIVPIFEERTDKN